MDISKIDSNFAVKNKLDRTDIEWHDVRKEPFKIYGLYNPKTQTPFVRLPHDVAKTVNEGVERLSFYTAGGRVRFKTNSPYVAINSEMVLTDKMPHLTLCGKAGFDAYIEKDGKSRYAFTFMPPFTMTDGYSSLREIDKQIFGEGPYTVTINFPLYNGVTNLYIGVKEGSVIEKAKPYVNEKPVVFYGSSITQGGCASRPGTCYQALISKNLNLDYINLGFSGSARGEKEIADYMANLPMCCFVSDYDYNAPNAEHLEKTHYPLYLKIREKHPDIPYIMISRPDFCLGERSEVSKRLAVVKNSYEKAVANGDNNVYFIDGSKFFEGLHADECTVDGTHPNDLGFYRMAEIIGNTLKKVLS